MARRKKKKVKGSKEEPSEIVKAPHSFVIKRGDVGKYIEQLMVNFRQIMEPFTASKLKVRKKNVIKDFVAVSSYLNVSHLIVFTKTDRAPYMRVCRMPRGPTVTYKIVEYTLTHDLVSKQRKPHLNQKLFQSAPLLVLNGFTRSEDVKFQLQTSMWRNMFPSIDVQQCQLSKIRRCVLLNYDPETNLIDLRHYAIKVRPVGLSKIVKKLVTGKKIPDLGQYQSVEEVLDSNTLAEFTESEGEAEEELDESRQVTLPQKIKSRGNLVDEKSSIRLYELGPRLRLELVKVEEGIMNGEVLYHSYIQKTKQELQEQKKNIQQKQFLKMSRRKQQEENVKRKMEQRDNQRDKQLVKIRSQQKQVQSQNTSKTLKKQKTETKTNVDDVDQTNLEDDCDYKISDDEARFPFDDDDDNLVPLNSEDDD